LRAAELYLARGHVATITETQSTSIMIESTSWFDEQELYQDFSCFSGQFKGHVCGRESLGTRLELHRRKEYNMAGHR